MLAMTFQPSAAPIHVMPAAPTTLGRTDGISIGFGTTWGVLSLLSAAVSGYHAYKRYGGEAGWTIGWTLGGAAFPIITPIVALIQGYGEPRRGKGFGRSRRLQRSPRRAMRRYRRRRD